MSRRALAIQRRPVVRLMLGAEGAVAGLIN